MKMQETPKEQNMQNTQKKQKRLLLRWVTVITLLLALAASVRFSYAWFQVQRENAVNVTPMAGAIGTKGINLLIASAENGSFSTTCELNNDGNTTTLYPISTADLKNFYQSAYQNEEGITLLYRKKEKNLDGELLHGSVYLKCEDGSCDVYFNPDELQFGEDRLLAALRLGLVIRCESGETQYIFQLQELVQNTNSLSPVVTVPEEGRNCVVASAGTDGAPVYTPDTALAIREYTAEHAAADGEWNPGSASLCHLNMDEVAEVEYYFYIEGCDDDCSNPVMLTDATLYLAFAGVETGGNNEQQ